MKLLDVKLGSEVVAMPSPFQFEPSGSWDGNDGSWSSFTVYVGTPPQAFRVLPSTAALELFLPLPQGCTSDDPSNCSTTRGVVQGSGYLVNQSSTWQASGLFTSKLEQNLGYSVNGLYGFDTVALGSTNVSLPHRAVSGIAAKDFYLGLFALDVGEIEFSGSDAAQSSYLSNLASSGQIPSTSYGYTAGAAYSNVTGSLTLGGFDSSRLASSGMSFPIGSNSSLAAPIQSILGQNSLNGTSAFLSSSINATVDSTMPYIWLPQYVCDAIATAFGLVYDNMTDLYLSDLSLRQQLLTQSPTLTFVLGATAGTTESITLPYAAFDLEATYPLYESPTRYFPIRRAANGTQYTLGRTFLQNAYLVTDYERQNFTLAPTVSGSGNAASLIAIEPPEAIHGKNGSVTPSAIAGIIVGVCMLLCAILAAYIIRRRRRRRLHARRHAASQVLDAEPTDDSMKKDPVEDDSAQHEVHGTTAKWGNFGVQELYTALPQQLELEADDGAYEMRGSDGIIHELVGSSPGDHPSR